ncbi:MAG: tripartite tricarboxylate transporter TctB family protein [Nitrospinota bacterium]
MRARNIGGALTLIAFGLAYGYLTTGLPERSLPNTPGPSFLPWILTACLLFLSGLWLAQALRKDLPDEPAEGTAPRGTPAPRGTRRAAGGLLALLAYLAVLPYLGFLVSTPPLVGVLMWTLGERRPLPLGALAIGIPLFLYGLFKILFHVPLPATAFFG